MFVTTKLKTPYKGISFGSVVFHPSRDDSSMLVLTNTLELRHQHKITKIRFVETSQATQSKQLHSVIVWCEQSCTTYSTEKSLCCCCTHCSKSTTLRISTNKHCRHQDESLFSICFISVLI